jgi:hypothetical protein
MESKTTTVHIQLKIANGIDRRGNRLIQPQTIKLQDQGVAIGEWFCFLKTLPEHFNHYQARPVVSNVFKNGKETSDFVIKYQSQIDKIWNELENPNKNNSQSTDINQINNLIVENNDLKERLAKLEQLFLEGNIPEPKKNNKLGFNPELLKKQLK